ncbi:hypothetical protein GCM10009654_48370 [Streptomyces hebeiensis]|uniref:Uncharacterized protein n=1 Tax=Streptomyces hebeiensis TaxID=229486 RepID=A0ABP4FNM1_9ACTN
MSRPYVRLGLLPLGGRSTPFPATADHSPSERAGTRPHGRPRRILRGRMSERSERVTEGRAPAQRRTEGTPGPSGTADGRRRARATAHGPRHRPAAIRRAGGTSRTRPGPLRASLVPAPGVRP